MKGVCKEVAYIVHLLHLPEKQKNTKYKMILPSPSSFPPFSKRKIRKGGGESSPTTMLSVDQRQCAYFKGELSGGGRLVFQINIGRIEKG